MDKEQLKQEMLRRAANITDSTNRLDEVLQLVNQFGTPEQQSAMLNQFVGGVASLSQNLAKESNI